jgi:hypothetical protein
MTWQPIETAPKDGPPILAYGEGQIAVCEWSSCGYWSLVHVGMYAADGYWAEPTHWMPLPEPPK